MPVGNSIKLKLGNKWDMSANKTLGMQKQITSVGSGGLANGPQPIKGPRKNGHPIPSRQGQTGSQDPGAGWVWTPGCQSQAAEAASAGKTILSQGNPSDTGNSLCLCLA